MGRQTVLVSAAAFGVLGLLVIGARPTEGAGGAGATPSTLPTGLPATLPTTGPTTAPAAPLVKVELNRAVQVSMPAGEKELTPVEFRTADGRGGWVIRLPGNRPIATPAYADGVIFVGGGYGSHEFYALDAKSGAVKWKMQTADDGPTAAVVEDGYVAFNTESCTVIVADAKTGKVVWQQWLGDPLMSQPAILKGRLYMAYPSGTPHPVTHGDAGPQAVPPAGGANPNAANSDVAPIVQAAAPAVGPTTGPTTAPTDVPTTGPAGPANVAPAQAAGGARGAGHRLLCADLRTGEHIWEQDITADVISAPVLDGDQVYLTCFDGTSFCLKAKDGAVVWRKQNAGISAPTVAGGQVVMTQKAMSGKSASEGIRRLEIARGEPRDAALLAKGAAPYLEQGRGGNVGLSPASQAAQDATVGFSSAPAAANLYAAQANANVGTVAGGWAYQGAKAAYAKERILNAQGNRFNCVVSADGKVAWQAEAVGKDVNPDEQVFAPPALGTANLYVCSAKGHIAMMSQKDGSVGFLYATGAAMSFQPALAEGNLYAGTNDGRVICLKTGDRDADGWTAWGGNAQHNKKSE